MLSLRKQEGAVKQVDSFDLPEVKTRLVVEKLTKLGAEDALIVTPERDRRLELAARNLRRVRVLAVGGLNVRDVLARKHLVLVGKAASAIAERLQ